MSSCPTKDIHSIYLDNELPAAYVKEYEAHISVCPKCATELKKMRAVRDALHADAAALTPDRHYTDQSYERLMARMSYSKVTRRVTRIPAESFKYILPAAAAAAIIALVLPVRMSRAAPQTAQTALAVPITRRKTVSIAKQNIVVNGTISHEALTAFSPAHTASKGSEAGAYTPSSAFPVLNTAAEQESPFTSVDVFLPDFDNEQQISIKVSVPGINTMPVTTEITLPLATVSGQLQ